MPMLDWVDTGKAVLRYEVSGQGDRVLVLLHEMGGALESWDAVMPALRSRYRVLRFDMRGFGLSEKIRGEMTAEQMADDVVGLLDALGLAAPVALLGCAVGAAVALTFAARHSGRTAMVAVSSPATGISPDRRSAVLDHIARFEHDGLRALEAESLDTSYPAAFRQRDPERFRTTRLRWLCNDPHSYAAVYRMLCGLDMSLALSQIGAPCLLIGCTEDVVRPPAGVAAVASRIPGAKFATVVSGHFLAAQNPQGLLDLLLPFLADWGSAPVATGLVPGRLSG
jgi:3-oxoadipate enol-lactonase